ncbi:hypothetical protein HMI54_010840 [Coelomomyces lativittatus]|nr:hypothetical protein HMI54_010840 [Coelomomyces lativittatus]
MYAVELGYAPSIPSPQINPSQAPKAVSTSIAPLIGDNDFNHIVDRSRKGLDPSQNDIDSHQIDFSTTLPHSNSTSTASLFLTNPPLPSLNCYALDWKLPLTAQYETPYANELIKPKVHFSDYSIAHLIASFQGFQVSIKEIIHASFMYSQQSNSPKLALKLFNTVTGLIPDEALGTLPHERAFLSKVIQIILSDVFLSMTSPMKLPSHMEFLKKEMKEIKADLKKNPTTQLLFCAFDHILTIKPSILLKYLHPLLAHASDSVVSVFQAHGLPPPDKKTMDNLLQIEMDWFIRLKREFPTVAFYVPNTESFVSKIITMDGGTGNKVAFVNCFGIWDLLVGEPGCLAKVWCKV